MKFNKDINIIIITKILIIISLIKVIFEIMIITLKMRIILTKIILLQSIKDMIRMNIQMNKIF
jgi:hypothetical protein